MQVSTQDLIPGDLVFFAPVVISAMSACTSEKTNFACRVARCYTFPHSQPPLGTSLLAGPSGDLNGPMDASMSFFGCRLSSHLAHRETGGDGHTLLLLIGTPSPGGSPTVTPGGAKSFTRWLHSRWCSRQQYWAFTCYWHWVRKGRLEP